ncbi:MAG TPA: aminotransferase class I/II-fold pyridoxal phosphate-dependent enzyme [Pyrinomonadaceae bacterium]|nr:aminotransferase class I/II-fold pyridoxal phosphate-dependent enzyme [Pyrinomonadaceae bacterium]
MINQTLSRRSFSRLIGVSAAYTALRPISKVNGSTRVFTPRPTPSATSVVRLSSNENPYGPAPAALKAMTDGFSLAWRYPDEHADMLADELARLNNVTVDQVLLGDGSGEILKLCAAAFTNKDKKLVIANPTFEAIARHAGVANAEVVKIDLAADYSHDLKKMLPAAEGAGLVYICNPNNPTASITSKNDLSDFLAKLSPATMVLVDEAYHHYVETKDYESVIPLVKQYPNLIVARTFSKIYGMAGLRCGYCVTQRENIGRMRTHQIFDSVNIMAVVAALASLKDTDHVAQGRKLNSEVKKSVCADLDTLGYRYIPSHANFMMIDLRRDVRPIIGALRTRGVEVGRLFPALPNFMRVTIGTSEQMKAFVTAFKEVMV